MFVIRCQGIIERVLMDAEQAVGFVADRTARSPEFVAEETRNGHAVSEGVEGGDSAAWTIDSMLPDEVGKELSDFILDMLGDDHGDTFSLGNGQLRAIALLLKSVSILEAK